VIQICLYNQTAKLRVTFPLTINSHLQSYTSRSPHTHYSMFAATSTHSNPFPYATSKAGAIAALTIGGIFLLVIIILAILISTNNCCCINQHAENEDEDDALADVTNVLVRYGLAAAVPASSLPSTPPPGTGNSQCLKERATIRRQSWHWHEMSPRSLKTHTVSANLITQPYLTHLNKLIKIYSPS
jgi:hypothetical protein